MNGRLGVSMALLVALVASGPNARAQSKQECAAAYTEAQVARRAGKLREARVKLEVCAAAACPEALRRDCGPWLAEVDRELPSLAIKPVDERGRILEGAQVTVDDRLVTIDAGTAVARVDAGEHVVRVEAPGLEPNEQRLTVAAGSRELVVRLVRAGAPAPPPPTPPPVAPSRPVPAAAIALGVGGLAGIAAFAIVGSIGNAKKQSLEDQGCKPACKSSDVDAIKTDYVVADVALGLGAAALVGAVIVFVTRPEASANSASASARRRGAPTWSIAPSTRGGRLTLRF